MDRGKEEHVVKGAGLLKKRTDLTSHNLINQMTNYQQYHMSRAFISPTRVLTNMRQTGKYYPSAAWAMTAFGKGMNLKKLEGIWKAIMSE